MAKERVVTGILTLLTISYCIFVWIVSQSWAILASAYGHNDLSLYTKLLISPLDFSLWWGSVHWQLFSVASLLLSLGAYQRRLSASYPSCAAPLVCHVSWILLCVLLHVTAFIGSFLSIAYVLKA